MENLNDMIDKLSRSYANMVKVGRASEREKLLPYFHAIFAAHEKFLKSGLGVPLMLAIEAAKREVNSNSHQAEEERLNNYAEVMIRADLKSRCEGESRHDLDRTGQRLKPGS